MAGSGADVGFDANEFRTAIADTMKMGSPTAVVEKAAFRWDRSQEFTSADPAGRPYVWAAVPTSDTSHPDVVVDEVSVEYTSARTLSGTPVGEFVPLRAQLTMLDVHHALVVGANLVLLHQVVWAIVAETQVALFSVDVFTLFLERQ